MTCQTSPPLDRALRSLLLLFALLLACFPARADRELTLGMATYRPKSVMEAQWRPLAAYLSASLPGHTVRLRILDLKELDAALRHRELDFVLTNPTHFVQLRSQNSLSGAIATLVNLDGQTPAASLGGVIIRLHTREDLRQLSDLRGKAIAAVDPDALGGYVTQIVELAKIGIHPENLGVRFTGRPHDRVIEAVLAGEADAGFIRSGVIEQLVREGKLDPNRLRIVNGRNHPGFPFAVSTSLYPEWPFVALPQVDEIIARRAAAALLNLAPDHPASLAAGIRGFTIPADYSNVEQAMRDQRLPPYDKSPEFTWRDVWSHYAVVLTLALLATAVILLLTVLLALGNRRLAHARHQSQQYADRLEQERLHLKTLIRSLPDLVWLKDAEGVYLGCNPRFECLYGTPEAAIVGKTDYDFVDREQADFFRAHDRKAMALGGPSVNEEWLTFAADGHRELVETTKTPMYDAQGHLIGVLGIGHDITERKRLEEALVQRDHYQRALLDNFPFVVWLKDTESRFLAVNEQFARTFGAADADALIGKTDLDIAPPDMAEGYRADDRAVLLSRQNKNVEEVIFDEGVPKWFETYKAPVVIDGAVIGTVGFARDISERKNVEKLLEIQHEFAGLLVNNPDRDTLHQAILDTSLSLPGLDGGGLYLRDADGGYRLALHRGLSQHFVEQVDQLAPDSPRAELIRAGRLSCSCLQPSPHCTDPELINMPYLAEEGILSLIVMPILANGEAVACLNLASKTREQTTPPTLTALETLTRQFTRALERFQAQEDAERQRQNFSELFDTIEDYLFVLDLRGRIVHVNRAVTEGLGYGASLLGRQVTDVHPEAVRDEAKRIVGEILAGQGSHCPLPLLKADGTRIMVDTQVVMGSWNGQPAILGISRDISEQIRITEALRDSHANLRRAQSISHTGSWTLNIPARRLVWSEETYRLFGVPEDMSLEMEDFRRHIHAEDLDAVTRAWRAALGGAAYDVEYRILSGDRIKWVREQAELHFAADGIALSAVGTVHDITERKQGEDLQRYSAFQAGIAEMAVSVLHNIGNAVTSVMSDTNAVSRASEELLRVATLLDVNRLAFTPRIGSRGLDADQAANLLEIQRQAAATIERLCRQGLVQRSRRINDSVQHIAEIVRIQQNVAIPATSAGNVDVGQTARDALAMLEDSIKRRHIQVQLEIDPTLRRVNLSRNRLLQALLNVVKNAYEAIEERENEPGFTGRIRVRVETRDKNRFSIQVTDNGCGFARDQQPELFRFGYSTKTRGSGFGLHSAALFVQELEGAISLESDGPGQGATLTMTLPRAIRNIDQAEGNPADALHGSEA